MSACRAKLGHDPQVANCVPPEIGSNPSRTGRSAADQEDDDLGVALAAPNASSANLSPLAASSSLSANNQVEPAIKAGASELPRH